MNLHGWDYTGRNISTDFHFQFRVMVKFLSDSSFVNHRTWGTQLQTALADQMGMSSPGQVRTVKKVCENFGLIRRSEFNSRTEPTAANLLTERGKLIYFAADLEYKISHSDDLSEDKKEKAENEIKKLYEEAYCDALKNYYYSNSDGTHLCPLRATLRALQRYEKLDKWEWYLMNTLISHDDNAKEEKELDEKITLYRDGKLELSMSNVKEKPKGHQYIPQYFEFAGLAHVIQRPEWTISKTDKHEDIKKEVMCNDFLKNLYSGGNKNG